MTGWLVAQISSRETAVCSESQEFPVFYGTRTFHYCFHRSVPFTPILRHMNLVHALSFCLSTINFIVFVPSAPGSFQAVLSIGFSPYDYWWVSLSPHTCHQSPVCYPAWFYHPDDFWWGVQIMKLHVMHFSPSFFHSICFALICFSTPCSLTSSFGILPLMSEVKLVSRPYETTGKVECLCLFAFL